MYICWLLLALCGGEEVTIDATAFTEGNVDIDTCHDSLVLVPEIKDCFHNLFGRVGKGREQILVLPFLDEVFH